MILLSSRILAYLFFFSLIYILQFGLSRISLQLLLLFHFLKFVKLYSEFHCSIFYFVCTIEKENNREQ